MSLDFAALVKPGVIPAVPERFRVKGIRTHATTGARRAARVVAEIRSGATYPGERWVWLVEGGVTGYESFQATPATLESMSKTGWCACAGTRDRWDTLQIDAENMKALCEWIARKLLVEVEGGPKSVDHLA